MFIIRHDVKGTTWETDCKAEARMYAIGGLLCDEYTVFLKGGGGYGLIVQEI